MAATCEVGMSNAITGRARTRPIQNLRLMSISSTLGPASALTSTGSKRHPTNRTWPRPYLSDLRVHRAGVDRSFRVGSGFALALTASR